MVGGWWLVVGGWWLVVGGWLLLVVVGCCWLLLLCVVVCCLLLLLFVVVCCCLSLLFVVVGFDAIFQAECHLSTNSEDEIVQEPSMALPSRAPKTGAQLRDNPEDLENCVKTAENPSDRHLTA